MAKTSPNQKKFRGLYNKFDPLSLDWSHLAQATNMKITSDGRLESRTGYQMVAPGDFTAVFSTRDHSKMVVVKDGHLCVAKKDHLDLSFEPILEVSSEPMHFEQVNKDIYFNNGVQYGYINEQNQAVLLGFQPPLAPKVSATSGSLPEGQYQVVCSYTLPDGRESGAVHTVSIDLQEGQALLMQGFDVREGVDLNVYIAPANSQVFQLAFVNPGDTAIWNQPLENLGYEMTASNQYGIPNGCSKICFHKGRMYAVSFDVSANQSIVWASNPLNFHLFDLMSSFIMLPGNVVCLASVDSGLIIGTEDAIYAYNEEVLSKQADFGVISGQNVVKETIANNSERVLLWTKRGLCSALPIQMLIDEAISVAPGSSACGAIIEANGDKHYVASLIKGSKPYNKY